MKTCDRAYFDRCYHDADAGTVAKGRLERSVAVAVAGNDP